MARPEPNLRLEPPSKSKGGIGTEFNFGRDPRLRMNLVQNRGRHHEQYRNREWSRNRYRNRNENQERYRNQNRMRERNRNRDIFSCASPLRARPRPAAAARAPISYVSALSGVTARAHSCPRDVTPHISNAASIVRCADASRACRAARATARGGQ
ncbi:hypothetical protein EVAR_97660_1 [Eumeta japonica]|uniref:Uncharacterized protein n=1 Tax=Eumeta variegata TaxID=151549 RepID=A0A4C1X0U9_EUMVA|nr:hypothetical protein EVAR_97660_1 [Eumeta japonica]